MSKTRANGKAKASVNQVEPDTSTDHHPLPPRSSHHAAPYRLPEWSSRVYQRPQGLCDRGPLRSARPEGLRECHVAEPAARRCHLVARRAFGRLAVLPRLSLARLSFLLAFST